MKNVHSSFSQRAVLAGASFLAAASSFGAVSPATPAEFEIKEMPASCRLLPDEFRKREATLLTDFQKRILSAPPRPDGYAFLLKPDARNFKIAAELIEVEGKCCPFFQFQLTLAQESRALMLEIRGPAGSRELLESLFRLPSPEKSP